MTSFQDLVQQSAAHAWLFVPSAVLLGVLHGLEPGHSKTMMAAFIVAIRGTVAQAILLGLAATLSHTLIVWVIAIGGLFLWRGLSLETIEPYFQLASAAIVVAMALWMMWRTRQGEGRAEAAHGHEHHHHGHGHDDRHHHDHHPHDHHHHGGAHRHDHGHRHGAQARRSDAAHVADMREKVHGLELSTDGHQDAHELAHANDIRRSFTGRHVTTSQIVVFGLTGGLIPCPAAITVLLLCLELKELALGFALVLCFSIGLAVTLVLVGVIAALGVRHATGRWPWLSTLARRAPYLSGALILVVGISIGLQGWAGLRHG
jgi:nickel/cobalt transporter (NicO) family protein